MVEIGKLEAILIPSEQIPGESFKQGDRIKVYVVEVNKTTKGPSIMISRTHPGIVKKLFELEVPEIQNGTVEIKSVAREAGSRTKIAVTANDENVDAIGSCVGARGSRVQNVVDALGEKVDIVEYKEDPAEFITEALKPAKVTHVTVEEEEKVCRVVVPDTQLSLAIGGGGQNARLAAKLTGWKIDIKSEAMAANSDDVAVEEAEVAEEE
jgi:N utilization substance protein A